MADEDERDAAALVPAGTEQSIEVAYRRGVGFDAVVVLLPTALLAGLCGAWAGLQALAGSLLIGGIALFGQRAAMRSAERGQGKADARHFDATRRMEEQHRETINLALGDPIARHQAVVLEVSRALFYIEYFSKGLRRDSGVVPLREKFDAACREAERLAPQLVTTAIATGDERKLKDAYYAAELVRWAVARYVHENYTYPRLAREKFDELYGGVLANITDARERARVAIGAGVGDVPANRPAL